MVRGGSESGAHTGHMSNTGVWGWGMGEDRVERIVLRIQRVYLAIVVLGLLGLISHQISVQFRVWEVLEGFLFLLINSSVYLGLRQRREWVITLVLIISVFGCCWSLVNFIQPVQDIKALAVKIFDLVFFLFFAYQIFFFADRKFEYYLGIQAFCCFRYR